jgi:hypothetical protein
MRSLRPISAALLIALLGLAFGASGASAAPGAYRIIIVQANCEPPTEFQAQLKAFPDVAAADIFDACVATPALAALTPYDMAVSMDNSGYEDPVAIGNVLADYVDAGGLLFQYAYDTEDGLAPQGRLAEGDTPHSSRGTIPTKT